MSNNIYQVLSSDVMDKVMKDHLNKIIIVLVTSRKLSYKRTKKNLFKDALRDKESLFIYVEHENFEIENKIPENILPFLAFYHNNEQLNVVTNFRGSSVSNNVTELKMLLRAKAEVMVNKDKTNESLEHSNKDNKKDNKSEESPTKGTIHKRALETQERLKELEQLEKLVKLKKLNAIQCYDVDQSDKSKSASSSLSSVISKSSQKAKGNESNSSF